MTHQTSQTSDHSSSKRSKATLIAAAGAAAAAAGAIAYKALTNGSTTYEVKPHEDGWQLAEDGSRSAVGVFATKKEAVSAGRDLADRKAPSELRIYNSDGELGDSHSYEPETD